MSDPNPTLIINPNESRCGNCGKGCSPYSKTHDLIYEYSLTSGTLPGCGIEWKYLTSHYTNFEGHYDSIRSMRPDLEWVSFI